MKAIREKRLILKGNVMNLLSFSNKFVEPHVLNYLFDEDGNPTEAPPKVEL
jgi:hypothetical protein